MAQPFKVPPMNLWIRVLYVLICSFLKPKIGSILLPSCLTLRVMPNDLDCHMHMNNGRYLTIMDLGRFDLILRTGFLKIMLQQKTVPVLASAKIRYRLPLSPFQQYTLQTRLVGWDKKWFYIEQRFIVKFDHQKPEVAAIGLVKGCFLDRMTQSPIESKTVLESINHTDPSPPLPQHVTDWQKAEDTLKDVTRYAPDSSKSP